MMAEAPSRVPGLSLTSLPARIVVLTVMRMGDLLTAEEAAALLRLNVKRVQALARSGKLPALRSGRRWLFDRAAIQHHLAAGRHGTTHAAELPGGTASAGEISARNQLRGRIVRLSIEGLMAEVQVAIDSQVLTSIITRASAERLGLQVGMTVLAVIKSTEVMVALPRRE